MVKTKNNGRTTDTDELLNAVCMELGSIPKDADEYVLTLKSALLRTLDAINHVNNRLNRAIGQPSKAAGCALCGKANTDGGIIWDDARFLCARCWGEAAAHFQRASADSFGASKRTINRMDCPF